jgi:Asp-tRNA(Asn)/Glu-tRNA(Gln) amidotransferase A subunit family amidase
MREMDTLMSQYDVFLSSTGSRSLALTNLTGHPAVAVPAGFHDETLTPIELMITGRLYDEATLLRAALAYEQATTWHLKRPSLT